MEYVLSLNITPAAISKVYLFLGRGRNSRCQFWNLCALGLDSNDSLDKNYTTKREKEEIITDPLAHSSQVQARCETGNPASGAAGHEPTKAPTTWGGEDTTRQETEARRT